MAFRDFRRWYLLWDSGIPLKGLSSIPLATALLNLALQFLCRTLKALFFPQAMFRQLYFNASKDVIP